MKRPLTPQEAFEQEGYVLFLSKDDGVIGSVVRNTSTDSDVPPDADLVITGRLSEEQAREYCQRVGWSASDVPIAKHFYKVIAE